MARPPHFLTSMLTSAGTWHLVAGRLARPIATRIEGAFDAQSRRRGLLGRTGLAEGDALVLMPSGAVHTFGMQFAIDVVYAKRDGRVIKLRRSMVRNRLSAALGAFAVIELPAGTIERTGLAVGDQLQLRASDGPEAART
ncbi:MAG: DUF192 domain-containing protein [Acidobacteriota bacterium]